MPKYTSKSSLKSLHKRKKETTRLDANKVPPIEQTPYFKYTPEGIKVTLIRAGEEFSDPSRGGTWYVTKKYEGQHIAYQETSFVPRKVYGVGGKKVWEKTFILKNPYYIDKTDAETEGHYTLIAIRNVIGKDKEEEYKERLNKELDEFEEFEEPEKIYAEAENKLKIVLQKKGYDSILFYHHIGVHTMADEVFIFN